MLQNIGGNITRAMTIHMQPAVKTASLSFHSDTDTWSDEVVQERFEPTNGLVRAPEKTGLGVILDRDALNRLKCLRFPDQTKWIIKTGFSNQTSMYNIADPKQSLFMVRPGLKRLLPLSYPAPLDTDILGR